MKIIFVRAKLDGVGHYRVSIPALALRDRGHTVDILDAPDKGKRAICSGWFEGYDACVIQNLVDPAWVDVIQHCPEGKRPLIVGSIDDLVGGLDRSNPLYWEYEKARPNFVKCMKLCEGMIFSTEEIARHYRGLCPNYQVVPNFLDIPGLRDWETREKRVTDRLTIGWLGGAQHVNDDLPMADGLHRVLKAHPEVMFAFCGNAHLGYLWQRSIGVPDDQWTYFRGTEFDGYQTRISHFDIGVAPLRDTEFNRCKSDLRLLEYGAWGVPYVASDVRPYRRFHEETSGIGGRLASTTMEWEDYLNTWIQNPVNRQYEGQDLYSYVREHRGNVPCGEAWEKAMDALLDRDNALVGDLQKVGRTSACPCGSGAKYKRCCFPAWG